MQNYKQQQDLSRPKLRNNDVNSSEQTSNYQTSNTNKSSKGFKLKSAITSHNNSRSSLDFKKYKESEKDREDNNYN